MNYIFDFDGTLVDSMPTWAGVHIEQLEKAGIPVPNGFVNTITPLGNVKASEHTISLGISKTLDEYLDEISQILYERYTTVVPLKEGVRQTLLELKKRGHILSVLTASSHFYLDECLQKLGVFDLFEHVWSIEDFSHTKSEPIIYEMAAKRLHARVCDCVFVDDNLTAITTAKMAGMRTVGIFDESSSSTREKIEKTADFYALNFEEILNF